MAVHGVPRYTKDLDIWLERSDLNAGRLLAVLRDFGFGNVGISESDLLDPDAVIQLGYEPNRIDLLTSITGVDFAEAHRDAVVAEFAGCTVRVLSRPHLIANKRAVARPRDLVDAAELEQR